VKLQGINKFKIDSSGTPDLLILRAGDILVHTKDAIVSTGNTLYIKLKESSVVNAAGVVRVKFDIYTSAGGTAYGRIYVNDSAVGTERTTTSITAVTFAEDITVAANDLVQLYVHRGSTNPVYCSNFRFYLDTELPIFTNNL